jgi:hypothetical protein
MVYIIKDLFQNFNIWLVSFKAIKKKLKKSTARKVKRTLV